MRLSPFSRFVSQPGGLSCRRLLRFAECLFHSLASAAHSNYIAPEEAARLTQLMRMNYETMHLFHHEPVGAYPLPEHYE